MSGSSQTIQQLQTIGDTATDWSQTVAFNQFDSSLGTLQTIDVGLTADMTGSVAVESLEAAPSTVSASMSGDVTVLSPTGALLADAAPFAAGSASLGAYDGSTDFAGASGGTLALSNTATADTHWQQGSIDLGSFVGTGTVSLPIGASASLHVNGPANLEIASQASAGAVVDLQYDYAGSGPGSPGGGTFGSGSTLATNFPPIFSSFENPVTTAQQTFTVADSTTGWSDSLAVDRFDPTLGTLEAINITLSGDLSTSVAAENEDAAAFAVAVTQAATLTLALPGATETTSALTSTSMGLAGYDGTPDFAGASGRIDHGHTLLPTTGGQLTDATDLAAFTGQGTLAVPLAATGTSSLDGPGNLLAKLLAQAGGTLTVSYTYVPTIPASDTAWTNTAGGEWSDGGNWSSIPDAPGSGDDIAIGLPGTYAIDLATAETVHSVIVDAPGATLVLDANLAMTGDFILDAGTIEFSGGVLSAGNVDINGGLVSGGTVDIESAGSIALNGGSIVATGNVLLQAGSTFTGPLTAGAIGAVLTLANADLSLDDSPWPGGSAFRGFQPGGVRLTSDNTSFHTNASGDRVTTIGTGDSVFGGAGADTVFGHGGTAWCHGGTGSLLFVGGTSGNSTVVGAGGASTLYGGSGGDNVLVGGKRTAIVVAGGNDMIWGGAGNDCIAGSAGLSTVAGAAGAATVFAGSGSMLVYGGSGSLVFAGGSNGGSTMIGGSGATTLFGGTGGNNVLVAGTGNAIIVGGGNGDLLLGQGSAGDLIYAGGGNETLVGSQAGNDLLAAGNATT